MEVHDFLLDLEGDTISDDELKSMTVESMNLARAGEVKIYKRQIVRRGEHDDDAVSA